MNFQLIEKTGVSLEKLFQKANPFNEKNCENNYCPVCDGSGITCRNEGVGYRGVCSECRSQNVESVYIGETGKNAYTRGRQHMQGLKGKSENNAFYKHWKNFHEKPSEDPSRRLNNFEIRVEKSYQDPITRQINEMVRMKNFQGTLLNSKSEWNAPPMVRIVAQNESEWIKTVPKNASGNIDSVQQTPLNPKV